MKNKTLKEIKKIVFLIIVTISLGQSLNSMEQGSSSTGASAAQQQQAQPPRMAVKITRLKSCPQQDLDCGLWAVVDVYTVLKNINKSINEIEGLLTNEKELSDLVGKCKKELTEAKRDNTNITSLDIQILFEHKVIDLPNINIDIVESQRHLIQVFTEDPGDTSDVNLKTRFKNLVDTGASFGIIYNNTNSLENVDAAGHWTGYIFKYDPQTKIISIYNTNSIATNHEVFNDEISDLTSILVEKLKTKGEINKEVTFELIPVIEFVRAGDKRNREKDEEVLKKTKRARSSTEEDDQKSEIERTTPKMEELSKLNPDDFAKLKSGEKDLRNARLAGADLRGLDLSYVDFTGACLMGAKLQGCPCIRTIFNDVIFFNTTLDGAHFEGTQFINAKFIHASLKKITSYFSNFIGAEFKDKTDLSNSSFLKKDKFINVFFDDVIFNDAIFRDMHFENCCFHLVDFSKKDLSNQSINFERVSFVKSIMKNVTFDYSNLIEVNFDNTFLFEISFKSSSLLTVYFQNPVRLENNFFGLPANVYLLGYGLDFSFATLKNCAFTGNIVKVIEITFNPFKDFTQQEKKEIYHSHFDFSFVDVFSPSLEKDLNLDKNLKETFNFLIKKPFRRLFSNVESCILGQVDKSCRFSEADFELFIKKLEDLKYSRPLNEHQKFNLLIADLRRDFRTINRYLEGGGFMKGLREAYKGKKNCFLINSNFDHSDVYDLYFGGIVFYKFKNFENSHGNPYYKVFINNCYFLNSIFEEEENENGKSDSYENFKKYLLTKGAKIDSEVAPQFKIRWANDPSFFEKIMNGAAGTLGSQAVQTTVEVAKSQCIIL